MKFTVHACVPQLAGAGLIRQRRLLSEKPTSILKEHTDYTTKTGLLKRVSL
ncbi:MAG: hypothetical protein A4E53_02786 [Pelotomaculum sp. PtaB.Bin104]|nr:MAG: hypothetical protein A4E53_02786 [Pelotomaculum sp. PtaB.Bin104]